MTNNESTAPETPKITPKTPKVLKTGPTPTPEPAEDIDKETLENLRLSPGVILCRKRSENVYEVMEQPATAAKYSSTYTQGDRLYIRNGWQTQISVVVNKKPVTAFLIPSDQVLATANA